MKITIKELEGAIKPDPSRKIKGRLSTKITDTQGRKYYCKPENRPSDLDIGMVLEIEVWTDDFGNDHINSFKVINDDNIPPAKELENLADDVYEETSGNSLLELNQREWLILIESCMTRYPNWNPNKKMEWCLKLYKNGPVKTLQAYENKPTKEQEQDLDNTALSNTPTTPSESNF
jgi:hypothetical protein